MSDSDCGRSKIQICRDTANSNIYIIPEIARKGNLIYNSYMISRISGNVIEIHEKYAIIDVHGVGYKVYAGPETLATLVEDSIGTVYTYLVVREDALDLYGFQSGDELNFFEMLLSVSGIGPKSALGILSMATIDTLKQAIGTGDTGYLTKVSGIGRKTAEKIIIELRDKLKSHIDLNKYPSKLRDESDVVEALKSLGYSQNEARDALKKVPTEIIGTNARIKEALKILGGK